MGNDSEQGSRRTAVTHRSVLRLRDGRSRAEADGVAVEEPLEVRVDGDTLAVTMRTPGEDVDLALGLLFAEGIIAGAADVGSAAHCGRLGEEGHGNVIEVRSAAGRRIDPERLLEGRRFVVTTSACGVCGRRSIDDLVRRCGAVEAPARLAAEAVAACIRRMAEMQPGFARTGGLHAAAIFAADETLCSAAEDVGRHNAVDKAVGALVRRGAIGRARPGSPVAAGPAPILLAVSGRASFEIVQKAAMARLPFVASVSAPSSLAVDLAERAGVSLVCFVRDGQLTVYANAWRLDGALQPETGTPHPA